MKALLVDDSRTVRLVIGRFLRACGYETLEAGNGIEALACLETAGTVDLALVDWNMPLMTGIEFVRAVRAQRIYDRMRIMMVTTESEACAVETALAAGADDYALKPFNHETIAAKLAKLCAA